MVDALWAKCSNVAAALLTLSCAAQARHDEQVVSIQRNGAWSTGVSGDETPAQCRRFQLNAAQVRTFFARAERVDKHAFQHDLDMSRCYAAGTLRVEGRNARWFIDLERRGSLVFSNGEKRFVYCLSCSAPPFDEMDDETAENAKLLIRAARKR